MVDNTKQSMHTASFKLEDLDDAEQFINLLIYGVPGAGKTTLAGSAADVPEMCDILFIDMETGKEALRRNNRIKDVGNIRRVSATSYKQVADVHKFLKAHCRLRDAGDTKKLIQLESKFSGVAVEDIKAPKIFNTVILDTLTEFNQVCLYELLGLSADMNLTEAMDDGEVDVAGFAEYKKNSLIVQLLVRAFRDLPINAIFTCHQSYIQDEMKRMHYAPTLTGKLAGVVQGFVDIVGYLKVGKLKEGESSASRRLYIQPVGNFDAKNRLASIEESFFIDPYMKDLWNAHKGQAAKPVTVKK